MAFMDKVENRIVVWASVTVLAIITNLITTATMVTFLLWSEYHHQDRVTRLETLITRTEVKVQNNINAMASDVDTLLYLSQYPWTRAEMTEFCIAFEKINKDVRCPDVLKLAPGLNLMRNRVPLDIVTGGVRGIPE
jgi:hypothetical protein